MYVNTGTYVLTGRTDKDDAICPTIMNDGGIPKIEKHASQIVRAKGTLNLSHDGYQ